MCDEDGGGVVDLEDGFGVNGLCEERDCWRRVAEGEDGRFGGRGP